MSWRANSTNVIPAEFDALHEFDCGYGINDYREDGDRHHLEIPEIRLIVVVADEVNRPWFRGRPFQVRFFIHFARCDRFCSGKCQDADSGKDEQVWRKVGLNDNALELYRNRIGRKLLLPLSG